MADNDEKQRAAARCEQCGEIGIVERQSDGTLKPLGQPTLCGCPDGTLRVLETDPDTDDLP